MKAQIETQWKVTRGVKEQLAHVVKEQKRKAEQIKELDKTKGIEQKKEVKEKIEVEQKRRKVDDNCKKKRKTSKKV